MNSVKYLASILLDEKLTWKSHINKKLTYVYFTMKGINIKFKSETKRFKLIKVK